MTPTWKWFSLLAFLSIITINFGHGQDAEQPAHSRQTDPRREPVASQAGAAGDSEHAGGVTSEPEVESKQSPGDSEQSSSPGDGQKRPTKLDANERLVICILFIVLVL